jgi:hypothetical protein
MAIMLGSFVVFRQIYLFITSRLVGTLLPWRWGTRWLGAVQHCDCAVLPQRRWEKRRVVVSPRAQAAALLTRRRGAPVDDPGGKGL